MLVLFLYSNTQIFSGPSQRATVIDKFETEVHNRKRSIIVQQDTPKRQIQKTGYEAVLDEILLRSGTELEPMLPFPSRVQERCIDVSASIKEHSY